MPPPAPRPAARRPSPLRPILVVVLLLAAVVGGALGGRALLDDGEDEDRTTSAATTSSTAPGSGEAAVTTTPPTTATTTPAPAARVPVDSGVGFRWTMRSTPQRVTQTIPTLDGQSIDAIMWLVEDASSAHLVFVFEVGELQADLDGALNGMARAMGGSVGPIANATFAGAPGRSCDLTATVEGRPFAGRAVAAHLDGQIVGVLMIADGGAIDAGRAEFTLIADSVAAA